MSRLPRICAAASVVAAFQFGLANAQDTVTHTYVVEGPGKTKCVEFADYPKGDARVGNLAAWLSGYMTAHHRLSDDIFDLTPWQTPSVLLGLLAQYCAANPDSMVEEGAQDLVDYLYPRAMRSASDVVAMRKGDEMVLLYETVLKQVRVALWDAGYARGGSEKALAEDLAAYQAAEGLKVTGLPDQATIARLLK